jgi:prolyl-tRNA editing enzyme YbaK/EbsC (Cys-tRNA(Pro) deacylase)
MRAPIGDFEKATPAPECLDELTAPVADAVRDWSGSVPADRIVYVDTEPEWADTAVFVEHYGKDLLERSANCVVVAGKRAGVTTLAACLVPSATRVDVNGVVRRQLGVRKASFAPMDTATGESGMEYGGITPLGLPDGWPVLVDAAVAGLPYVLVGSGRRRGKLLVPGEAFAELPNAVVLEGLGVRPLPWGSASDPLPRGPREPKARGPGRCVRRYAPARASSGHGRQTPGEPQTRSYRSAFMTLFQAWTKSATNFSLASSEA